MSKPGPTITKELLDDMAKLSNDKIPVNSYQEVEKGHGKVENDQVNPVAIHEITHTLSL